MCLYVFGFSGFSLVWFNWFFSCCCGLVFCSRFWFASAWVGGVFLYSFWNVGLFCNDLHRSVSTSVISCLMVQVASGLTWGKSKTSKFTAMHPPMQLFL